MTQLQYRLSEGNGECMYYLGVEDDGYPRGLNDQDLAGVSRLVCLVDPPGHQHFLQGRSTGKEPALACSRCTQCCAHSTQCLSSLQHMCSLSGSQISGRRCSVDQHASLQLPKE